MKLSRKQFLKAGLIAAAILPKLGCSQDDDGGAGDDATGGSSGASGTGAQGGNGTSGTGGASGAAGMSGRGGAGGDLDSGSAGTTGTGGVGGSGAGGAGNDRCPTPEVTIDTNHGHTMTVSAADVAAGTERTYQIQGAGDHPHEVVVSPEQFTTLRTEQSVQVISTQSFGHSHYVTVTCT